MFEQWFLYGGIPTYQTPNPHIKKGGLDAYSPTPWSSRVHKRWVKKGQQFSNPNQTHVIEENFACAHLTGHTTKNAYY